MLPKQCRGAVAFQHNGRDALDRKWFQRERDDGKGGMENKN